MVEADASEGGLEEEGEEGEREMGERGRRRTMAEEIWRLGW